MEWLERASLTVPGASQTFSKGANQFVRGASPLFLDRGAGARVWDVDGHEYLDFTMGLCAVTLGYDIGPRVTATLGRLQYMVESHRSTHAISGTFGSAAAAGCAAGLNAKQMRWLLSYSAQQASGLASWQRDTDHIEKSFDFGGMPARNGVTAALLVQAGGTGVDDILSGADNFFQAFVPKNDSAMIVAALGERYEITRTNIKKWTVGAPIQAPLDALDNLLKQHRFGPDQVKQIVVRVAADEATIVDNREIPDICLQHLMAVMLVDKTVSFKSAHDNARMQDPAVLRQRVKVQLDLNGENLEIITTANTANNPKVINNSSSLAVPAVVVVRDLQHLILNENQHFRRRDARERGGDRAEETFDRKKADQRHEEEERGKQREEEIERELRGEAQAVVRDHFAGGALDDRRPGNGHAEALRQMPEQIISHRMVCPELHRLI